MYEIKTAGWYTTYSDHIWWCSIAKNILVCLQEATVDDCLLQLREKKITQPVLFLCSQQYCIKVDNSALMLPTVGGFVEAVERLFMVFHVFSVHYPDSLRVFYSFLEVVMGISSSKQTPMVRDLLRKINTWSCSGNTLPPPTKLKREYFMHVQ